MVRYHGHTGNFHNLNLGPAVGVKSLVNSIPPFTINPICIPKSELERGTAAEVLSLNARIAKFEKFRAVLSAANVDLGQYFILKLPL